MSAFDDAQRIVRARRDAQVARRRARLDARLDRLLRGEYMIEYTYIIEPRTADAASV